MSTVPLWRNLDVEGRVLAQELRYSFQSEVNRRVKPILDSSWNPKEEQKAQAKPRANHMDHWTLAFSFILSLPSAVKAELVFWEGK